jgi:hypothetical protein
MYYQPHASAAPATLPAPGSSKQSAVPATYPGTQQVGYWYNGSQYYYQTPYYWYAR